MPRLRGLRDPGRRAVGLPGAGDPAREVRDRLGHRLLEPFPYYMNTYGFHGIHGRAPAIATGIKIGAPRSRGLGRDRRRRLAFDRRQPHDPHAAAEPRHQGDDLQQPHLRAHQGAVLADLGAGQEGEVDALRIARPPCSVRSSLALGAEATFVARSLDVFQPHLKAVLKSAAAHRGSGVRRDPAELQHLQRRSLGEPQREGAARGQHDQPRARPAARLRQAPRQGPAHGGAERSRWA